MSRTCVPLVDRFWPKVDRSGGPAACWPWQGVVDQGGYGRIGSAGRHGPVLKTHRVAYELVCGPIPPGAVICHTCDNPPCCNPAHLFAGTAKANTQDSIAKGRMHFGERDGHAKLTATQVRDIRQRRASGVHRLALAQEYGLHPRSIDAIVRRQRWAHLSECGALTLDGADFCPAHAPATSAA